MKVAHFGMKPAHVLHAIFPENPRRTGHAGHCSKEQRLNVNWRGVDMLRISNALKWKTKLERHGRKRRSTI